MGESNRRTRTLGTVSALAAVLLLAGCGADTSAPSTVSGQLAATLVAPGPVSAAVLEFRGVTSVSLEGGLVFSEFEGDLLRVVLLLDEPGDVEFLVAVEDDSIDPEATVVEVADRDDRIAARLEDYRVRFGR